MNIADVCLGLFIGFVCGYFYGLYDVFKTVTENPKDFIDKYVYPKEENESRPQ